MKMSQKFLVVNILRLFTQLLDYKFQLLLVCTQDLRLHEYNLFFIASS